MGVYQRTSTHSSITYTDDKGIWGIHEEDSGKEHAMVSRLGKLWFKISIEDTMRLIKEDQFRETIQEEWCSRELLDEEQSLFLGGEQVTNVDDDVDDSPENDLALNVDHVFEADECDAFDSDVDEGPTTQTMFMANLTSEDSIYDEAGPSYDSNNPCEMTISGNRLETSVPKPISALTVYSTLYSLSSFVPRILQLKSDLEAVMSNVHDESKHISKLERECLNLQLKYQHLQESFGKNKSHTVQEAPDFNSFVKIKNLEHQIQEKDNVIRHLKDLVTNVNERSCEPYNAKDVTALIEQNDCVRVELEKVKPKVLAPSMYAINVKPIPHPLKNNRSAHLNYISHLKESVEIVREIVEEARVDKPLDNALNYACQYTKLSQELLEYVIGTCPKRVNTSTEASGSKPRSNTKKNRIPPAKTENKKKVEDHPRTNKKKDALGKLNCGYQWRPTGKKFALGELCHLTKLSMQCCIGPSLVSGLRLFKTYDGESFKAQELCGKVHRSVRFGNDHLGAIMGYGDYVILVDSVLSRVYTQHTYFVRDIEGTYILKGSRSTNLYTISIDEMMKSLDMLLSKVPTRSSQQTKNLENTNMEVLHTLHMDLCGPMRVQSIKGKKYILVIVDDYSRFTWVKFLRSKDETPDRDVLNTMLPGVGIFHQKSVPRTPQQNGIVERRNRTLVEAARTMMIRKNKNTLKAPMFLWAEAVATACYTQNRSLIHTRHNKTPYELVHEKKPDLTFFRVFGALCYPTNDSEDLGKFQAKADIGIFVGYAPSRKGYRIYNKRTRRLMETIHVTFDEMHQSMAPVRISSGPEPFIMTPGQLKSGLAPTDKELEMLFQPMFDEHLEQSRVNEPVPSATDIDAQVVPPGTSVSTTIAQDAPSTSASSSTSDIHHPVQHQEIAEEPIHEDTPINHDVLHPSHNLVTGDPGSFGSNIIGNVNSAETQTQIKYIPDQSRRGTKDHPLDNIVGNPSHPVSTRKQLASDALWCCFHTELSKVEPKNFKIAMIKDCWFQAMQDEIHEFDRLKVWELVPRPIYMLWSFAQLLRIEAIRDILCNVQSKEYDHSTRGMSKMSMMGQMSFFLGLQVSQSPGGIFINQAKYALETLKKYGMDLSDPESIHQWWIDGNGRGISWGIFQLTKLDSEEWLAPLCTLQMRIMRDVKIQERSTSGMVSQFLGDRLVSWSSKKQRSMAISTTEAEYITMSGCCAQILWMRSQVSKQRYEYDFINFSFVCDNKSVLLFAVTTSSTLDQNTSTYVTISSVERSKKIEWLNSTSWKRIISLQTFSPKHYQENGSNFFFHA
ncbi:putative ribonuclease H-like domain-containing protein [Tanacetum coccineum]